MGHVIIVYFMHGYGRRIEAHDLVFCLFDIGGITKYLAFSFPPPHFTFGCSKAAFHTVIIMRYHIHIYKFQGYDELLRKVTDFWRMMQIRDNAV